MAGDALKFIIIQSHSSKLKNIIPTCLLDESDPNYNYRCEIEVAVVIVAVSLAVTEWERLMDIAVHMTAY